MNIITESDKKRIINFINQNDLDLIPVDNGISRFGISTHDKKIFFIYEWNQQYVLVKYDPEKELESILSRNPGITAYEYFQYQNLQQILEQLTFYDQSLYKRYWEPIKSTIDIPFIKESYDVNWLKPYSGENWKIEKWNDDYEYPVYTESRKIKVHSPFNTLHEVSLFNQFQWTELNTLNIEIHPIFLTERKESYLVKILINDEPILKEWINYRVETKKGLDLFMKELFDSKNPNVQID